MKSYTDLEQSRKLAEILPLESADMCYEVREDLDGYITKTTYTPLMHTPYNDDYIPCWSLASLLGVLPKTINFGYENDSTFVLNLLENGKYLADYYDVSFVKDNPVDACVAIIERLHELNLL